MRYVLHRFYQKISFNLHMAHPVVTYIVGRFAEDKLNYNSFIVVSYVKFSEKLLLYNDSHIWGNDIRFSILSSKNLLWWFFMSFINWRNFNFNNCDQFFTLNSEEMRENFFRTEVNKKIDIFLWYFKCFVLVKYCKENQKKKKKIAGGTINEI